jgi:GNAT superfamily N-acetyltransferase
MDYEIHEVDGISHRHTIEYLNSLSPEIFPALTARHLEQGYWWLVYAGDDAIGFAGLVPFYPFPAIGYLKRCLVKPDHHGHGLQYRLMVARIAKAKRLGWTMLVSECGEDNGYSSCNFSRAGLERCEPEQRWGAEDSIYWIKKL